MSSQSDCRNWAAHLFYPWEGDQRVCRRDWDRHLPATSADGFWVSSEGLSSNAAAVAVFALVELSETSDARRVNLSGPPQPEGDQITLYEIDGFPFFGATERLLETVPEGTGIKVLVLQLNDLEAIDATGACLG